MAFVEHKPQRTIKEKQEIGIFFRKRKAGNVILSIRISRELADKINLKEKDRVKFYYDNDNPFLWKIVKTTQDETGYRACKCGKGLKFQVAPKIKNISWDGVKLKEYFIDEHSNSIIIVVSVQ